MFEYKGSLAVAATAVVGAAAYVYMRGGEEKSPLARVKDYNPPKSPAVFRVLAMLPRAVRKWLSVQMMAPRSTFKDCRDLKNEPDAVVYRYDELVPDKLWRVPYTFQSEIVKMMKALGNTCTQEEVDAAIARAPQHMRKLVEQDFKKWDKAFNKMTVSEGLAGGFLDCGLIDSHNCMVARLKSGGLLLYAPSRIHPDFASWLESRGEVKFIVLGSSSHTTYIAQAALLFPGAKVIGTADAERKLQVVGMRKFDFLVTSPESLAAAKAQLAAEDIALHHMDGDSNGETVVIAHKHAMFTDLVYTHADGDRFCVDRKEWETDEKPWFARVFFFQTFCNKDKSPNGFLPIYRLQFMDPTDTFTKGLAMDPPPDNCTRLASSLRCLLADAFDTAVGVHPKILLPRKEFQDTINRTWGWLDERGRSLLPSS